MRAWVAFRCAAFDLWMKTPNGTGQIGDLADNGMKEWEQRFTEPSE